LIGGLGLGFTLKRTLELVGKPAMVEVAELMPPLIEWNRTFLVEHNGPLLEDPRTKITQGDLFDIISSKHKSSYDALLLDIDNTPDDLITAGNARLYSQSFLAKIKSIIKPNGCVAYWLSEPAPKFKKCLSKAGFHVEAHAAKPHEKSKRARHCIYVATTSR
jgi:spermidine synthase